MMKILEVKPDRNCPYAPRFAAVGMESGIEIRKFERRSEAFDFVNWHNEKERK